MRVPTRSPAHVCPSESLVRSAGLPRDGPAIDHKAHSFLRGFVSLLYTTACRGMWVPISVI